MKKIAAFALLAMTGTAFAQYKCVDGTGRTSFQQAPCASLEREQKLKLPSSAPPTPVPAVVVQPAAVKEVTRDQQILSKLERERRISELSYAITDVETAVDNRNTLMLAEMNALVQKKQHARNNLAGATWEQSISTEMQAVSQKYKALNDVDMERSKMLRAELARLQAKP